MTTHTLTEDELRELYRKRAPRYDLTSHVYGLLGYRLDAYRRRGIELLALHSGDTIVEIGCGTGANLARLERAVGPTGAIIGVDLSPAMLEQARARVRREGWSAGETDLAGYPDEQITEGLDGLRDRLAEYARMGARFAKWRAALAVAANTPSRGCIEANAHALARYAALCQEAGLVPVVEPEVLMDGAHTLERSAEVTEEALRSVFSHLYTQRVMLEGMILKPNMVVPGLTCPKQETVGDVADATVRCLLRAVPAAVPGIAFLSGGQPGEFASARLNSMNVRFQGRLPWALSFSFARAIQQPALEIWRGSETNVLKAQKALYHRARCNQAARRGEYSTAMEGASA